MIERATLSFGARRSAALIAISQLTRRDLIERLPRVAADSRRTAGRRRALYGAAAGRGRGDARQARAQRPLPAVGWNARASQEPARLAQAAATLDDEITLAIVGPPGWELDEVMAGVAGSSRPPKLLGHVPDEDLPALYRGATLFCYPSLYEGFGFPILEAMSCGTPVLTSDRSSMPEVGGDAALLRRPDRHGADVEPGSRSCSATRSGCERCRERDRACRTFLLAAHGRRDTGRAPGLCGRLAAFSTQQRPARSMPTEDSNAADPLGSRSLPLRP